MNKIISFVRLDFITIKPYFTVKNILIYAVLALFLTTVSVNIASAIGVGMMFATMLMSYPFAIGEKSNVDALYAILSIDRKTVVLGRYFFVLSINLCAIIFSFLLVSVSLLAAWMTNSWNGVDEAFLIMILLAAVFFILQAIQLPFYFKFGNTKARFLSVVPFIAIMAIYFAFSSVGSNSGFSNSVTDFFTNTLSGVGIAALAVLIFLLLIFASYRLSLSFYSKREF
jgi:hypothetical protein